MKKAVWIGMFMVMWSVAFGVCFWGYEKRVDPIDDSVLHCFDVISDSSEGTYALYIYFEENTPSIYIYWPQYIGKSPMDVICRFGTNKGLMETWKPSKNGHNTICPLPEEYILMILDNDKLIIRVLDTIDDKNHTVDFDIIGLADIFMEHIEDVPGVKDMLLKWNDKSK
jgi:hypothetical protein